MSHRSRSRFGSFGRGSVVSSLSGASLAALLLQAGCGSPFETSSGEGDRVIGPNGTLVDAGLPESGEPTGDAGSNDASTESDGATSDAASTDAGPTDSSVTGCDASAVPHDQRCVIDEAYGVFVAPVASGGSDSGDGTRRHPYATLGKAIPLAVAMSKRVYACGAAYAEALSITPFTDGVQVFGGLMCPTAGDGGVADAGSVDSSTGPWSYDGVPASVVPAATGYALTVNALVTGAHFEDVAFTSLAAVTPGSSSIAVMVNASTKVSLVRVQATAGAGAAGASGAALVTNYAAGTMAGSPGTTVFGGVGGVSSCPVFGSSAGGVGGDGSAETGETTAGTTGSGAPATTLGVAGYDGKGGAAGAPEVLCGKGLPGGNGTAGMGGGAGAGGSMIATGWNPAIAGAGNAGNPGQGGGGAGGELESDNPLGGAGGGAGGCGGNGGGGGGGGGASIALAIAGSTVSLALVSLVTAAGGAGGAGANGEAGQAGGSGGTLGCNIGGVGGQGAGGSGGGGGAGGPSLGIALLGGSNLEIDGVPTASALSALAGPSSFTGGAGGVAGPGGRAGAAAPGDVANQGALGNPGTSGPSGIANAVAWF